MTYSEILKFRILRNGNDISMPKNVIVAQSGGPSPVINNSLQGDY